MTLLTSVCQCLLNFQQKAEDSTWKSKLYAEPNWLYWSESVIKLVVAQTTGDCGAIATSDLTFFHLITLIAGKRVEGDNAELMKGEAVTGTIWGKHVT